MIEDLVNLGFTQIYLKLMIDGLTSAPFSAVTLPPIPHPDSSYVNEIIGASREQYARVRASVEAEIIKFHEPTPKPVSSASKPISSAPRPISSVPSAVTPAPVSAQKPAAAPTPIPKPASAPAPTTIPKPAQAPSKQPSITMKAEPKIQPSPTPPAPQAIPQLPVQPTPPPKPNSVPLSSLAPKPQQKPDPKVPTEKNVADLKNALAAVLGKNRPASVAAAKPPKAVLKNNEKIVISQVERSETSKSPAQEPKTTQKPPINQDGKPAEVPEDVLKNVLKID
jgi:hypothetical protein